MAGDKNPENLSKRAIRILLWHERLITFFQQYLNEKQFVTISGVLIGITSALAAILLKAMVFYLHTLLFTDSNIGKISPYIYSSIPLLGILITALIVKRYFGGNLGGGNAAIMYAIRKKESRMPRELMYSHVITSAITVGTGGSTGLETPIVTTGAAIGSNYGKTYKVGHDERTLMLASGVAAGIAATFNAPIAGVLFAVEVLISEITIAAFIPILIAAASGAILSKVILDEDILLNFSNLAPFDYHNVPFYIILGLLSGVLSVYYIRTSLRIDNLFRRVKQRYVIQRAIIGGLLLGGLILLFPPLFGEGYESIKTLAGNHAEDILKGSAIFGDVQEPLLMIIALTAVLLLKVIATSITLGSGGNGGNFAPSLFTGAYLGYIFAGLLNLTGIFHVPPGNFTVVAMGGVLSGIFHAPLTAIFLIAEITGGYDLIIPLMIVSAISFGVSRYLYPYALDGLRLKKMLDADQMKSNTEAPTE